MSKLSELVKIGMKQNTDFATLPIVVEKEILHHDVVSLMNEAGVLSSMVFMHINIHPDHPITLSPFKTIFDKI